MAFLRNLFKTYPLVTNCVVYGGLYATAEFSQQTVLKKILTDPKKPEPPYDTAVLGRYFAIGTFALSPALYYWYKWLDATYTGVAVKTVVRKCVLDQLIMTPYLIITFYVGNSILEGKKDIFAECKQKFVPTYIANALFWVPCQVVNFTYVPAKFRVVYMSMLTLVWVNVLCVFKRA